MNFLYIFEDDSVRQSSTAPTADELSAVQDGLLMVIKFDGGQFEELTSSGVWKPVSQLGEAGSS